MISTSIFGKVLPIGAIFVCLCSAPTLLFGQVSTNSSEIVGTIKGSNGTPIDGAQLILFSPVDNRELNKAITGGDGHYRFSGISLGTYKLSASASGFHRSEPRLVILSSSSVSEDFVLAPQAAEGLETGKGNVADKNEKIAPPSFSAAGVHGNIAPSGYSTGLSSEEVARVSAQAKALEPTLFARFSANSEVMDCGQEPALLHAVKMTPHEFAANRRLGLFYQGRGEYSRSVQYLEVARASSPEDRNNNRDLAISLMGSGHSADAVELLKTLLLKNDSDSTLLRLLALAYKQMDAIDMAITTFQRAATVDASVDAQYDCGVGLIQLGAYDQARDLLGKAIAAHPESAQLWFGLGLAEQQVQHKKEALESLLHASSADPNYLAPLMLLSELSDLPDSIQTDVRQRIASYLIVHPNDERARFSYASILSKQDPSKVHEETKQEIITQLTRVVTFDPRMARAHFLLGDTYTDMGDQSRAIKEYETGLQIEPDNSQAHYRLAQLYRNSGQLDRARTELDRFRSSREVPGRGRTVDAMGFGALQTVPGAHPCGSSQR